MIAFIDDHREAYGVEPICKLLPIAPSTYYDHAAKRRDPTRRSARAKRDAIMKVEVRRVFDENFQVCGVRKIWRQLPREGFDVARSLTDVTDPSGYMVRTDPPAIPFWEKQPRLRRRARLAQ